MDYCQNQSQIFVTSHYFYFKLILSFEINIVQYALILKEEIQVLRVRQDGV